MPNFVCDICGGAIKMQANKTGVCQGCGMEYDIEAIRAMAGAAPKPVPAPAPVSTAAPQQKDELDRDALLIYLSDVRTLETIIKKTNNIYGIANLKIRALSVNIDKPKAPEIEGKDWESKISFGMPVKVTLTCVGMFLLGLFTGVIIICIFFGLLGLLGFAMIVETISNRKKFKKAKSEYEKAQKEYEKEVEIYNQKVLSERKAIAAKRQKFEEARSEAEKDSNEMKEMLEKAYSANIIPLQFRNIEGVYYLYDYLSTSNQSLSEALMQANLEAIKQKLDEVIKNQSEQIVLQAQANAKLNDINRKNQQILEAAQATMNNTAVAAKYAQIAAVNSTVTARLAAKSLAYQRAEFWLN